MTLGYDESNWGEVQTNPIEYIKFADLIADDVMNTTFTNSTGNRTEVGGTDEIEKALMELDLFDDYGLCWDFYINHYGGYSWAELGDAYTPFGHNVQDIVSTLGWDEDMWDDATEESTGIPQSECQFWITLDPIQKWAYHAIGWDEDSFDSAPCGKFFSFLHRMHYTL